ncbi:SHOCT domain-containing protein [Asanoa sp. WMMD1127]|uniref:SHOCT domain-containing protein n=1 Tax=Asanoa sp. WMMD1127 TaxID=3016107 RepID=UPI0024170A14|nr:SHOCT domain-containing protein [Asanoa sp. WMMD1127]MDG4824102.1 SHOCT domain-containing protein [Asanoa sp. WMMD1127]
MLGQLTTYAADPAWHNGPWNHGGPGWWIVFPIVFWVLVVSVIGYFIWNRSPRRSARHAAEQTLAERYARGEIDEHELRERRANLRDKR